MLSNLSIASKALGLLFIVLLPGLSRGQEKIFEFSKPGIIPIQFQSFADSTGRVVIAYTTQTETLPRKYKTFFVFNTSKGPKELMLPLNIRVYQVLFKEGRLLLFLRTREDDARSNPIFDIFEIDQEENRIVKTHRHTYAKETVLSTFNAYGAFYILSILKKTNEVRVRIFKEAAEPMMFTYKVSNIMFDELSENVKDYTFVHSFFERPLDEIYTNSKCFIYDHKLFLRTATEMKAKDGTKDGPTFLELSLNQESPGLRLRQVNYPHKGFIDCYPVGDKLYLYQPLEDNLFLGVASLSTFEIIKRFSLQGEGDSLLQNQMFFAGRRDWSKLDFSRLPTDEKKKLKKLNSGFAFVYALPTAGKIRICFGSYEFPVNTVPTAGPGSTGSVTVQASKPNYTFMLTYLNPDLTIAEWEMPGATMTEKLERFMEEDANKAYSSRFVTVQAPLKAFIIAYSNKEDNFIVWAVPYH